MVLMGLIIQNVLFCLAIVALACAPVRSQSELSLLIASAGVFLAGLAAIASWVYPPMWFAIVFALVWLIISVARWNRFAEPRAMQSRRWITSGLVSILALAGLAMLGYGIVGRMQPDGETIRLKSPFPHDKGFCVLSGGNALPLNLHYVVGAKTAASFERHAVDFAQHNAFGFRTTEGRSWHPKPLAPSDYAIFNEPVYAPCSGDVVETENTRPDNLAGHAYRDLNGANRVVLKCEGYHVWLAHLKRGSVVPGVGDVVEVGAMLGRIGNSGNTEEPHLHIHAQTVPDDPRMNSEPVIMLFGGRYLAKGDCL